MVSESKQAEPTPPPVEPKIIKRYSNRKLYDTVRSKYVTLEEIAEMIRLGEEVTIIDNKSKDDLTSATLAQIIFETEKKQSKMPLSMLRNLIQTSGDALQDFFDKSVKQPVETVRGSAHERVEEIKHSVEKLRDAATKSVTDLTDTVMRVFHRSEQDANAIAKKVEAILRRYEASFEELSRRLESQIKDAPTDGMSVVEPLVHELHVKLGALSELATKAREAAASADAERAAQASSAPAEAASGEPDAGQTAPEEPQIAANPDRHSAPPDEPRAD